MFTIAKPAKSSSFNPGRSDRSIVPIYFVRVPIVMVFLTDLHKKERIGAFYGGLAILFVYTPACSLIHLNQFQWMQLDFFPDGFYFRNVFISTFQKTSLVIRYFTVNVPGSEGHFERIFSSVLDVVCSVGWTWLVGATAEDSVWRHFAGMSLLDAAAVSGSTVFRL